MNKFLLLPLLLAAGSLAGQSVLGQDAPGSLQLEPPPSRSLNHFGASFRMGFNIKTDFKTSFGSGQTTPGVGVHGVDRTYDDGYNKVDSTGNAGGYTTFWGYEHDGN